MIVEHPADCGDLYEDRRRALLALLADRPPGDLGTPVPATPAWTVHDVLSHLVGLATDLNAQRFPTGDPEAWTAAQVERGRAVGLTGLARQWDAEAPRFCEGLRLLGHEQGSHFLGDLLQHASDVAAALDADRLAVGLPLLVALDHYLDTTHQALVTARAGAVDLRVDDEAHRLGDGGTVASVALDPFEAFRTLGGRRSEAQIRAQGWQGDLEAVLPHLSAYPLPAHDLVDP